MCVELHLVVYEHPINNITVESSAFGDYKEFSSLLFHFHEVGGLARERLTKLQVYSHDSNSEAAQQCFELHAHVLTMTMLTC